MGWRWRISRRKRGNYSVNRVAKEAGQPPKRFAKVRKESNDAAVAAPAVKSGKLRRPNSRGKWANFSAPDR